MYIGLWSAYHFNIQFFISSFVQISFNRIAAGRSAWQEQQQLSNIYFRIQHSRYCYHIWYCYHICHCYHIYFRIQHSKYCDHIWYCTIYGTATIYTSEFNKVNIVTIYSIVPYMVLLPYLLKNSTARMKDHTENIQVSSYSCIRNNRCQYWVIMKFWVSFQGCHDL